MNKGASEGTSRGKSLMKRRTNNAAFRRPKAKGIFNTTGYEDKDIYNTNSGRRRRKFLNLKSATTRLI